MPLSNQTKKLCSYAQACMHQEMESSAIFALVKKKCEPRWNRFNGGKATMISSQLACMSLQLFSPSWYHLIRGGVLGVNNRAGEELSNRLSGVNNFEGEGLESLSGFTTNWSLAHGDSTCLCRRLINGENGGVFGVSNVEGGGLEILVGFTTTRSRAHEDSRHLCCLTNGESTWGSSLNGNDLFWGVKSRLLQSANSLGIMVVLLICCSLYVVLGAMLRGRPYTAGSINPWSVDDCALINFCILLRN